MHSHSERHGIEPQQTKWAKGKNTYAKDVNRRTCKGVKEIGESRDAPEKLKERRRD